MTIRRWFSVARNASITNLTEKQLRGLQVTRPGERVLAFESLTPGACRPPSNREWISEYHA